MVREDYMDDINMYLSSGYSNRDCYDASSDLKDLIEKTYGEGNVEVEIVRLHPDIKHYVVMVRRGRETILIDPVPELSGKFSDVLRGPIILMNPAPDRIGEEYNMH